MKNKVLHILISLLLTLPSIFARGSDIQRLTADSGLPIFQVTDIVQDNFGKIWIGTLNGIAVTDGNNWKFYGRKEGLENTSVQKLAIDDSNKVWAVSTSDKFVSLYYFDKEKFKEIMINDLRIRRDTYITGFEIIHGVPIFGIRGRGIFFLQDNVYKKIGIKDGLLSRRINSFNKSGDSIFVCTDKGVQIFKNFKLHEIKNKYLKHRPVLNIIVNKKTARPKWVLTRSGLYLLKGKKLNILSKGFNIDSLNRATHDLNGVWFGKLFFGDKFFLFAYDTLTHKLSKYTTAQGFLPGGCAKIFIDNDNNVWFGNYYGISKLNSMSFLRISDLFTQKEKGVTAINALDSNHIIVANKQRIFSINVNTFQKKDLGIAIKPFSRVLDLTSDKNGNVHLAFIYSGFCEINKRGKVKWELKFPNTQETAVSVVQSNAGLFYLTSSRLLKKTNGKLKAILHLPKTVVRKLFVVNDSIFVITTSRGLIVKNGSKVKRIRSATKNNENIFCYFKDKQYGELVGGVNGVFKIESDTLKKFQPMNFRLNSVVYFILKAHNNDLWFGTNDGVYRYTGRRMLHYTRRDGLIGSEMNRSAAFVDRNGNLWFGSEEGLSVFDYRFDKLNKVQPPKLILTRIESGQEKNIKKSDFNISYNDNELIFHLNVITQDHPQDIKLLFKLNNYDKKWMSKTISSNSEVRYTNLPLGKYCFKVKAVNFWGDTSTAVKSHIITVQKPFYATWWFILIVVLFSFSFLYFIGKFFFIINHEQKLKEEVEKATKKILASNEKYQQMFRNNKSILLLVHPVSGKILDANNSALEFYGYSLEELKNINFNEIDSSFKDAANILSTSLGHTNYRAKHKLADGQYVAVDVYVGSIKTSFEEFLYVGVYDVSREERAQNALMDIEEKYKAIIENIQDGLFMIHEFKLVYVNPVAATMLGRKANEIIGKNFDEFVAPEDLPMVRERYIKRKEGQEIQREYVANFLHKDGSRVTMNVHLGTFMLGGELYTVGTLKDVTTAYKAQKALEESEKQYRELFENIPVGIYRTSVEGEFILANDVFVKMLGYDSLTELQKIKVDEGKFYVDEESKEKFRTTLSKYGTIKGFEYRLRKKDGKIIYIRESARANKDADGNVEYYEGIVEDITLMKRTLERLKVSEERNAKILDSIPDPIFELSPAGKILNVRNWEMFKDVDDVNEYIGESFEELIPDVSINEYKESFTKAYSEGEITEMNISYIEENEESHFELRILKIDRDLILVMVRDITEIVEYENVLIKAKEAAEKSDRLKSEFLAQMSHEIRTPLNAILSFNQLIEEECKSKVSEEFLPAFDSIQRGGARLLNTIELILRNAEVQAGTYEMNVELISLGSILSDIVADQKIFAQRKGLTLTLEKKVQKPLLEADKFTVSQIFINLIENAIKYTSKGFVKVTLYEKKENLLAVDVEDSGIGIEKEFLPHLFDPFSQEDTGYTRKFEGTGLGLSLVKKYVELNNGEIMVESEKGKGTKFTVVLPTDVEK